MGPSGPGPEDQRGCLNSCLRRFLRARRRRCSARLGPSWGCGSGPPSGRWGRAPTSAYRARVSAYGRRRRVPRGRRRRTSSPCPRRGIRPPGVIHPHEPGEFRDAVTLPPDQIQGAKGCDARHPRSSAPSRERLHIEEAREGHPRTRRGGRRDPSRIGRPRTCCARSDRHSGCQGAEAVRLRKIIGPAPRDVQGTSEARRGCKTPFERAKDVAMMSRFLLHFASLPEFKDEHTMSFTKGQPEEFPPFATWRTDGEKLLAHGIRSVIACPSSHSTGLFDT